MRETKRGVRVVSEEEGRRMLKVGDVSKRSGVGVEALRFYERGGLIDTPARTESGYRVYGEDVLERLAFIKRAQSLGLSLDEIKGVITAARSGTDTCDDVRMIVRRRVTELDERLQELESYRNELKSTLEEWDRVGRAPGHICGLVENSALNHGPYHRTDGLKKASMFLK